MAFSPPQRNLILHYFFLTLGYGVVWVGIHFLLHFLALAPSSLLFYLPVILLGAILADYRMLRLKIRAVQFKGAGKVTVPTVYYMSILTVAPAFLQGASLFTDRIVEVETIDQLPQVNDSFIQVRKIFPRPEYLLDTTLHETKVDDEDGESTWYQYTALVPLAHEKEDTLFTTWIVSNAYEALNGAQPETTILAKKEEFGRKNRASLVALHFDSIQYFEKADANAVMEMRAKKKAGAGKLIFVRAFWNTPAETRWMVIKLLGWSYVGLSIFFIGAVAFGHYEEIVND